MKRFFPIVILAVVLSSCLDTQSHYTPYVTTSAVYNGDGDSLSFRYDGMSGLWNVDSVRLGDTLTMSVGYGSLGNNLVSTHLAWDTTCLDLWANLTPKITDLLLPTSDTTKLDLYMPLGYNYLGFPIWFVPKKAGSTTLKFTVVSDSKYSPQNEILVLNVEKE